MATTLTGPQRSWTPGELRVLEVVAKDEGWEYAERYAARFLAEARAIDGDDLEAVD